jgi:undecaprenyl pyrophosphate phosphatase UppP
MTVQTSMNFIGWLMRKWFSGLIRLNKWWTRKVQDGPGEAFFLMLLFSGVIFILAFVPGLLIMEYFGINLFSFILISAQVIWVGNYFRIIMNEQYRQFKEEQNRMFNEIKHSDRRMR